MGANPFGLLRNHGNSLSMSIDLVNLSLKVSGLSLAEHSILNILAIRADEKSECWPSIKSLSENSSADRKTIMKVIDALIEKKLLIKTGEMKGRTKSVPVYKLLLSGTENGTALIGSGTTFSGSSTKSGTAKQYQKRDMERSVIKDHRKGDFSLEQDKQKRQKNYQSKGQQSIKDILEKLVAEKVE